jgi:FkbM family methyltransferase
MVTVVLDVGANTGQYVDWLRDFGYDHQVVSFEPIPEVFGELRQRLHRDERWLGVQAAVGARGGTATMQVMRDSKCSSLLAPRAIGNYIPGAAVAESVEVPVVSLDDAWSQFVRPDDRVAVKIDVQGFEAAVLDGLAEHVRSVSVIEVEVALTELYEGATAPEELLRRLGKDGFGIVSLDRGFVDSDTGQVLDIDMLLERRDALAS